MERLIGLLTAVMTMLSAWCARADSLPEQVTFQSADGRTMLTGYLFMPSDRAGKHAAVVMMHGRGGVAASIRPMRKVAMTALLCRSAI
jgi:poly(3-hydroxybutyrate) depolymerase